MEFQRTGAGEPLLLLHGVGSRGGVFEPVTQLVAQHYDTVVPDLPGFGRSAQIPLLGRTPGNRMENYADAVESLADQLGFDRFHVVGNSMGGGIALELGTRGRARSVCAFAPIGFWRTPGLKWTQAGIRLMRAGGRAAHPVLPALASNSIGRAALFGMFYGHPASLDPERGVADVDGLLQATGVDAALRAFEAYKPTLGPVVREIPVTIAWGSRDRILTYATQARRARWLMPWASHVTLPGCGHLPFSDDPIACFDTVLSTCRAAVEVAA